MTIESTYLSAPNSVIWDVTSRCNLKCRHCYVEADTTRRAELTTAEAALVIEQLRKAKVFRLSFSGGEALLRDDIYTLLDYATPYFPVELASNGLLITEEVAQQLKSRRVFVQLSLDGLEEAHDYLRGRKGAFEKLTEAMQILRKEGVPFGVTTVIYRRNAHEIKETISFAEESGALIIRFYRLIHAGRGKEMTSLDLTPGEYEGALRDVYTYQGRIRAVADEAFGFLLHGRENPHQWVGCQAGRTLAGIKADGHVVPCPMFCDPVFFCGKVPGEDFKQIWEQSPVLQKFRTLEHIQGKCHTCQYLHQCGGGCRAAVYACTGDLYASDYQCFLEGSE